MISRSARQSLKSGSSGKFVGSRVTFVIICSSQMILRRSKKGTRQAVSEFMGGAEKLENVCATCSQSFAKGKIPTMAVFNGFAYPEFPKDMPESNVISIRLKSARVPSMQTRRLRIETVP